MKTNRPVDISKMLECWGEVQAGVHNLFCAHLLRSVNRPVIAAGTNLHVSQSGGPECANPQYRFYQHRSLFTFALRSHIALCWKSAESGWANVVGLWYTGCTKVQTTMKSFNIKTAVFEIATNILCIKNRTFQEFSKSGLDEFARDSQVRSPTFGVSLRWLRCSQFGDGDDGDDDAQNPMYGILCVWDFGLAPRRW